MKTASIILGFMFLAVCAYVLIFVGPSIANSMPEQTFHYETIGCQYVTNTSEIELGAQILEYHTVRYYQDLVCTNGTTFLKVRL